jgi:tRNA (cytidine/uridine-2'-O-)-methyltransferase
LGKPDLESAMLRLCLYQPDIPHNTGPMIRLAACMGAAVEIIEPCGFILDNTRLRRAHMDYIDLVSITRHADLAALRAAYPNARWALMAPQGETSVYDFAFAPNDILIMGPESQTTLPLLIDAADAVLRLSLIHI